MALVAYLVFYWPWKQGATASPVEFFAALPVLMGTTVAAISLGSTKVVEFWRLRLEKRPWLCWTYPAGIWLLYALGTLAGGHAVLKNILVLGVYLALPVAFAQVRQLWGDWLMVASAAVPILCGLVYLPNLPAPEAHHQVQVHPLFGACIGFWAVSVVRNLDGFQFRLAFSLSDLRLGLRLFAIYAIVIYPLSIFLGFGDLTRVFSLHREWHSPWWAVYTLLPIGMYFYPALVEEALYRGVLQNLLAKSFRSQWLALAVVAVVFGWTHFKPHDGASMDELVWFREYVVFAVLAGAVYGYAYLKTKRIMPGAIAHALVDSVWLTIFNPDLVHFTHHG
jgi:membrane protease YdiL (CAAX protease family)